MLCNSLKCLDNLEKITTILKKANVSININISKDLFILD